MGSNPTGGFFYSFALGCTCKLACRVQRGGQCVLASPRVDFKISGLCELGLHHPAVAFPPSSAAFPLLSTLRPPPSCSAGRQGLGTIAMRFQTRQAWLATCGRWCAWPIIRWRCKIHVFGKDKFVRIGVLGHMSFCQEAGSHMARLLTKGARLNQHCVIVYFGGADNRC